MNVRDLIFWAWRSCRRRLLESILIALAVGMGVGVIVSVLALFHSVYAQQSAYLVQQQYRTIRLTAVEDLREVFAEASGPLVSIPDDIGINRAELGFSDLVALKSTFPNAYVFVELTSRYPVELESRPGDSGDGSSQGTEQTAQDPRNALVNALANSVTVTPTTPDFFAFRELTAARGSLFLDADVEQATRVIVLGSALAERLFGSEDPVGKTIVLGRQRERYEVVGVLAPTGSGEGGQGANSLDNRGYIPFTARPSAGLAGGFFLGGGAQGFVQSQQAGPGVVIGATSGLMLTEIYVGLPKGANIGAALRNVREYVFQTYADTVSVYSSYEAYRRQQEQFLFMGTVLTLFASMGLIIAAVNILNLMLARIYKRMRSIGISVAIGASRRAVFQQFLAEAALLGAAGAVIGILLSFGGVRIVSSIVGEGVSVTLVATGIGVLVAIATSLLFGTYPALQASRVEPMNALRID